LKVDDPRRRILSKCLGSEESWVLMLEVTVSLLRGTYP
jgi:hypothetical protein